MQGGLGGYRQFTDTCWFLACQDTIAEAKAVRKSGREERPPDMNPRTTLQQATGLESLEDHDQIITRLIELKDNREVLWPAVWAFLELGGNLHDLKHRGALPESCFRMWIEQTFKMGTEQIGRLPDRQNFQRLAGQLIELTPSTGPLSGLIMAGRCIPPWSIHRGEWKVEEYLECLHNMIWMLVHSRFTHQQTYEYCLSVARQLPLEPDKHDEAIRQMIMAEQDRPTEILIIGHTEGSSRHTMVLMNDQCMLDYKDDSMHVNATKHLMKRIMEDMNINYHIVSGSSSASTPASRLMKEVAQTIISAHNRKESPQTRKGVTTEIGVLINAHKLAE